MVSEEGKFQILGALTLGKEVPGTHTRVWVCIKSGYFRHIVQKTQKTFDEWSAWSSSLFALDKEASQYLRW